MNRATHSLRRTPPPTERDVRHRDPPSINPHSAGSWLAGGRGAAANIANASRAAGGNDGARLGALYYKNGSSFVLFRVSRDRGELPLALDLAIDDHRRWQERDDTKPTEGRRCCARPGDVLRRRCCGIPRGLMFPRACDGGVGSDRRRSPWPPDQLVEAGSSARRMAPEGGLWHRISALRSATALAI